jgi:phosphatidylserine decarboxylase
MRIPLTKYGWPQVVIYPVLVLALMFAILLGTRAVLPPRLLAQTSVGGGIISIEALLAAVLIWSLMFFRDPERRCPSDRNLLLAPADGQVTDIETVDPVRDPMLDFLLVRDREDKGSNGVDDPPAFLRKQEVGGGVALRIGIFLSIFDTHINRAPCNVKVEKITYRKGKYKNAMNPQSGRVNESNDLHLVRTDSPQDRLIVRQISGAIARRIVCDKVAGKELTGGQKFGMIKFGSRTELYVPLREAATPGSERYPPAAGVKCLVQIGDKVKAGLTPLVKYEIGE